MRIGIIAGLLLLGCGTSQPPPSGQPADHSVATAGPTEAPSAGVTQEPITITEPSQRAAAVGKRVRIVGVQTRTKIPTVCGVDVDGDYDLSEARVVVTGTLRTTVVEDVDAHSANRGPGTFYQVLDESGELARPTAADR